MKYKKRQTVAMILAGGQGSRLGKLTEKTAKPAVPFGGKYRIIDFALSNCVNSGIDTVGVLTQYQPLDLNEYIKNGQPWDLDRNDGGVFILQPYQAKVGAEWYKGTANAIYQNADFIKRYSPDFVLILSGDHIYNMDYSKMLASHILSGAAASVAVIDVPLKEASRFGIMRCDEDGRIYEFEEKPEHPKSTLASMGVYIFNTEKLLLYLEADNEDKCSHNDFGKDIIPGMIRRGEKLFAYRFNGYWRDVGTVQSLWEANMDLLGDKPEFSVNGAEKGAGKIYTRSEQLLPMYCADGAEISNSIIGDGCRIYGKVKNSVLFGNVTVEDGAEISDAVILESCTVRKGARLHRCIVSEGTEVPENVFFGTEIFGAVTDKEKTDIPIFDISVKDALLS